MLGSAQGRAGPCDLVLGTTRMIKVACPSCSAPYDLDERRLLATGLRMRCPRCGSSLQVFPDGRVEAVPAAPVKKTQVGVAPPPNQLTGNATPAKTLPTAKKTQIGVAPPPNQLTGNATPAKAPQAPSSPAGVDRGDDGGAAPVPSAALSTPPATVRAGLLGNAGGQPESSGQPGPRAAAAPPTEPRGRQVAGQPQAQPPLSRNAPHAPQSAAQAQVRRALAPPFVLNPSDPAGKPDAPARPAPPPARALAPKPPPMTPEDDKLDLGVAFGPPAGSEGPASADLAGPPALPKPPNPDLDLPAPRAATAPQPPPPQKPPTAGHLELDLPALRKPDLPARGGIDLPARREPDLPALREPNLPALRDPDLPAPRRGRVDLPAPKAAATPALADPSRTPFDDDLDLPAPRQAPNLPAPKGLEFDPDLPAPRPGGSGLTDVLAATDDAFGELDLPLPKTAAGTGEADRIGRPPPGLRDRGGADLPALHEPDLPALREPDLPARREPDLPAPRQAPHLPVPKGLEFDPDLPAPRPGGSGLTDVLAATDDAFGELDLPLPKTAAGTGEADRIGRPPPGLRDRGGADLPALREPDLPAPGGIDLPAPGGIDLPAPGGIDLPAPRGASAPSGEVSGSFGDLELPTLLPSARSAVADGLELPPPSRPVAPAPDRGGGHGETDRGAAPTSADDMEFADLPQASPGQVPPIVPVAPPIKVEAKAKSEEAAQRPKRPRALILAVALVVAVVGAGAGLSFTPLGPFGIHALEPFMPGAGDPARVSAAIHSADELATHDVRSDSWRALVLLGRARHDAGLHRPLLARSLMHEALFQIRFGTDSGSSARAAVLRQRLERRGLDEPAIALGIAADDLRRGDVGGAQMRMGAARAHAPSDPFVAIVDGEIALAAAHWEEAADHFRAAAERGGGAAAHWGLARALMHGEDEAAIDAAIEATLIASPMHAGARVAKARRLLERGDEALALALARQVVGQEPVDGAGTLLEPSAADRVEAWLLLAQVHERRGRTQQARAAYEEVTRIDGTRVEALLGAGRGLLEDRPADALARFESVLEIEQGTDVASEGGRSARDEARLGAARAKMALGRVEEARAELEALASERPQDAKVVLWLGRVEERLGHGEAAEQHYRDAIRLAPQSVEGYLALAQYYVSVEREPDAVAVLDAARAQVPESAGMRQAVGQFELARNRIPQALRELSRALELDPQLPSARFALGVALRRAGALDEAERTFNELGESVPGYPGLALERGRLYEARGQSERAMRFYSQALERSPDDPNLLLRLGAAQVGANQIDEAERTLERVARLLPQSAETEFFLGRVHFARGNLFRASSYFERAITLDTTRAEYHLYAAWAQLELGHLGRALERAETAIERDATLGDAYWIRGRVLLRRGAVRDALADLQRALELSPGRIEALAAIGDCYDELRQLPRAIDAYTRAVAARENNGEWWYRLGRLQLDAGHAAEAARALGRATRLGDATTPQPYWLADALRLRGDALRLTGDRESAIEHYRRYLQIAPPTSIDRAEVRRALTDLGVIPPPE
jgi:tetratricopeptide (TPR) repeat protein